MANAETTFADREGRGQLLSETVKAFSVPFTPTDVLIQPVNYDTFLGEVHTLNSDTNEKKSLYTTDSKARLVIVKDVKNRCSLTMNYILSVSDYKPYNSTIRNIVKKILHYKPPKSKLPNPEEPPAEEKKRNRGELSFADVANRYDELNKVLGGIAGYDPTNADLKLLAMTALQTSFETKNKDMNELHGELSLLIRERKNIYDGENGLRERMKAIKAAVRAQYGSKSEEYDAVKGIRV